MNPNLPDAFSDTIFMIARADPPSTTAQIPLMPIDPNGK